LKCLTPEDFPDVPAEEFDRWRNLELKSINIFALSIAATIVLSLVAGVVLALPHRGSGSDDMSLFVMFGTLACFLLCLLIAAIPGTKAQKLKKSLGITWPKKG